MPDSKSPVNGNSRHHPETVCNPTRKPSLNGSTASKARCGVAKMISEDRYCVDILNQVAALQSALDAV
jgi:hypothetical protein